MPTQKPVLSVIVSVYNAERTIGRCLEAILDADFDRKQIELILSNDASKDRTMDYINTFAEKYRSLYGRLAVISPEREGGVSVTRNRGLEVSKGDFVVFIDSDIVIPRGFFVSALKHFKGSGVGGVAAVCPFERKAGLVINYYENMKEISGIAENAEIGTGATMYSAQSAKGLKFDERVFLPSYEDADFAISVMERGYKTLVDPNISALHLRSTSLKKEMRVIYRKGVDMPLILSKHPGRRRKLERMLFMNMVFLTSFCLFVPFALMSLFYVSRMTRNFKRKRPKYVFVGLMLDLSKSLGLMKGMVKWRKELRFL